MNTPPQPENGSNQDDQETSWLHRRRPGEARGKDETAAPPSRSLRPENEALDAALGVVGFFGLLVQMGRRNENEICWKCFFGTWVLAWIVVGACNAAIG